MFISSCHPPHLEKWVCVWGRDNLKTKLTLFKAIEVVKQLHWAQQSHHSFAFATHVPPRNTIVPHSLATAVICIKALDSTCCCVRLWLGKFAVCSRFVLPTTLSKHGVRMTLTDEDSNSLVTFWQKMTSLKNVFLANGTMSNSNVNKTRL